MQKIGVTQWFLKSSTGPQSIELAARLGFHSIHINAALPEDPWYLGIQEAVQNYRKSSKKNNIHIAAISANLIEHQGFLVNSSGRLEPILKQTIEHTFSAADLLQSEMVYFPNFNQSEITNKEAFEKTVKILQHACDTAKNLKIQVATENTLSAKDNEQLISRVNRQNLKLLLDLFNPLLWGHSVTDFIDHLFPHLADQIHIKDGIGKMGNARLGQGDAKLQQTLAKLMQKGFKGSFILENDYLECEEKIIKQDLFFLQAALNVHSTPA